MQQQRTLKKSVSLVGVGLHTGRPASVTIRPSKADSGIWFHRTDLENAAPIPAHYKQVTNTQLATTIGSGTNSISTVEHLMCALQGLGIDNAQIEVNGPELPIMDGSADPFYQAMKASGIELQKEFRAVVVLKKKIELKVGDKWAIAEPSNHLKVSASIEWNHPGIGSQMYTWEDQKTDFTEISRARTFGFLKDVEALQKVGLARGASLENAVGLDEEKVLNPGGLRYPNEFARHKVLDALGDLKLSGIPLVASIHMHKAGHDLHWQLLSVIFKNPDNYEILGVAPREQRRSAGLRAVLAGGFATGL